jgi:hypothetical protein
LRRVFLAAIFTLAAVWGILSAAIGVYQITNSVFLGIGVVAITALLALVASAVSIFAYLNNIRSGYPIFRTPSFITIRKTKIYIGPDFAADIDTTRDIIFLSDPDPSELIDMADTLKGFQYPPDQHLAKDSTVVDHISVKQNVLVLRWSPKRPIIPLVPYRHRRRMGSPSPYGPDFFYHSTYFDRDVGLATYEVNAPRPLEEVFAFVMPRLRRQVSERAIYRSGMRSKRKRCQQPVLSADRQTVTWTLKHPDRGRIYVVFGLYEGERSTFMAKVKAQAFPQRISAMMRHFFTGIVTSLQLSQTTTAMKLTEGDPIQPSGSVRSPS